MIQVYTGDGKGKTTAALGMALRATGAGLTVYICQFLKNQPYSELAALKKLKNITFCQHGRRCFIRKSPTKKDIQLAQEGFLSVSKAIASRAYNVVILDEINCAINLKLIEISKVIELLKNTPSSIELILTGRNAPKQIRDCADLVSEIKEVKHYFKQGIKARKGIEY
ncbi:MAG: cob(I)yrinic acid a,c-diamide adenosyltransferase [Candidatus Omnitrophota bacterium]|jgi:cob(I)alamin adenosyltransferase